MSMSMSMSIQQQQHNLLLKITSLIEDEVLSALSVKLKRNKSDLYELYRPTSTITKKRKSLDSSEDHVDEEDKDKDNEKDKEEDNDVDDKSEDFPLSKKIKCISRVHVPRSPIPHGMIFQAKHKDYEVTVIYNVHDGGYYKYLSSSEGKGGGLTSFKSLNTLISYWKMVINKPLVSWREFKVFNRHLNVTIKSFKNYAEWNTWIENPLLVIEDYCDAEFEF